MIALLGLKLCSNQISAKLKLNGTLRTGSPWFDVLDSFIAFICAFAALPAADLSNSSCLQVEENESQLGPSYIRQPNYEALSNKKNKSWVLPI